MLHHAVLEAKGFLRETGETIQGSEDTVDGEETMGLSRRLFIKTGLTGGSLGCLWRSFQPMAATG